MSAQTLRPFAKSLLFVYRALQQWETATATTNTVCDDNQQSGLLLDMLGVTARRFAATTFKSPNYHALWAIIHVLVPGQEALVQTVAEYVIDARQANHVATRQLHRLAPSFAAFESHGAWKRAIFDLVRAPLQNHLMNTAT